ncbi:hypothetical protein FZEAL_3326 [Fusarium zealandicum]|uniref:BTB domain-containing protein n=1 Tax=Fusarium zealandicum TaxID=1053134 RepID=A0A8H4XLX1_9HYPO|nr:hypothetical protein FZEAL_3326 [Fusarium zealandicum]
MSTSSEEYSSIESITSISPKPAIKFDPDGDLCLTVGCSPSQDMIVDSRALCRASRVFSSMLRGGFAESQPNDGREWNATLPDDPPTAFAILMDLAHAQFKQTPEEVSVDELYAICVLTNKYDMVEVLRPMADRWFKSLAARWQSPFSEAAAKMMFVAWELGCADKLGEITLQIAWICDMDEDGDLITEDGQKIKDMEPFKLVPVYDCIQEFRLMALETFHDQCQFLSFLLLDYSLVGEFQCRHTYHDGDDIARMMGKMLSAAYKLDVLDLFSPGNSFLGVSRNVYSTEWMVKQVVESMDVCEGCEPRCEPIRNMLADIEDQIRKLQDPLHRRHLERMKIQASRVGMIPRTLASLQESSYKQECKVDMLGCQVLPEARQFSTYAPVS